MLLKKEQVNTFKKISRKVYIKILIYIKLFYIKLNYIKSKKISGKTLNAFSLIEVTIVLIIVGVIAGAIIKGKELVDVARVRSIISDVDKYKIAFDIYKETYKAIPGDDSAASRFGEDVKNGDGDGFINENDSANVWKHLYKANQVSSSSAPKSKFGGNYFIIQNPSQEIAGIWLRLGDGEKGEKALFTPKQAQLIMSKGDDGENSENPLSGNFRFLGENYENGECIKNGKLNLDTNKSVCVGFFKMD